MEFRLKEKIIWFSYLIIITPLLVDWLVDWLLLGVQGEEGTTYEVYKGRESSEFSKFSLPL